MALSKLKCWSQVSGINTNVKRLQTSGWRDILVIAVLVSDSESLVKSHLWCTGPGWPWTSPEFQVLSTYKVADFSSVFFVLSSIWPICFFSTESAAYRMFIVSHTMCFCFCSIIHFYSDRVNEAKRGPYTKKNVSNLSSNSLPKSNSLQNKVTSSFESRDVKIAASLLSARKRRQILLLVISKFYKEKR